ncbi:MAG: leucine-rich repeat domain-containing protein [Ruminococcaceae bacterium]|nr:leucine-rich repeat domain-containing protein [Oscillospiraceae bacterium]
MKKILLILVAILALCFVLISCGREKEIDSFEIIDGELIIYYTNGTSQNLGEIEGEDDFEYYPLSDGTYAVSVNKAILFSEIEIPSTYRGKAVTQIKEGGFKGATNLKKLTIPSSITKIDKNAFSLCSALTEVYIDSIEAWCNIEFQNDLANPLKIAKNLYVNDELVTNLVIPNTVTEIKDYAFYNCDSLINITIPQSVTNIGNSAFATCGSLKNITIGNGVTSIGENAFSACTGLVDIIIGNNVTSIGYSAFGHCESLTDITIPDCVTSIGDHAFSDCISLKNATIGNGVTSIGEYAFSTCTGLVDIIIGNNVTGIGDHAFFNCRSLKSVKIPESVTIIENSVFRYCDSLTSVMFENTSGWYVTETSGATSGTDVDLTNASINATYLNDTYDYFYWYKK